MARVLVADDSPDILTLLVMTLEMEGHEVVTASDGAEAVQVAAARRFDAVVLDVMMPKVDGLAALRQLRRQTQTSDVPVLMLSAKAEKAEVDLGIAQGANAYLTKPFEPDHLVAEVERLTRASGWPVRR